jgi:hypothetical protein
MITLTMALYNGNITTHMTLAVGIFSFFHLKNHPLGKLRQNLPFSILVMIFQMKFYVLTEFIEKCVNIYNFKPTSVNILCHY